MGTRREMAAGRNGEDPCPVELFEELVRSIGL